MKPLRFFLLFILSVNFFCSTKNKERYLIESVRKLSPSLSLEQVKMIFSKNEHVEIMFDKKTDSGNFNMDRKWAEKEVHWQYGVTEDITDAGCVVYFDSTLTIVGFLFSAPNGPQLKDDELLFQ